MGPLADYVCTGCGERQELAVAEEWLCPSCSAALRRVWKPVAIGRVAGAGDSPARQGST